MTKGSLLNWIKLFGEVNSIRVKSITDPVFRFGLLFGALGVAAACFKAPDLVWMFCLVCCAGFLIVGISFYIYFAIKKPDYLRSESFQISKQSLEMLGDEKNRFNPNMDKVIPIANPQANASGQARLGSNTENEP
ncbi:MAG: hypothetical protein JNJ91_13035 [Flavobacteriales bacterium]|nr:hypothetical protein [Flavobacteriales bacterium]